MRFEEPESLILSDRVENVRPGGYIPEEHVKDMDTDGIDVGIVFPSVGAVLYSLSDTELLNSMFRTYNDWLASSVNPSPSVSRASP